MSTGSLAVSVLGLICIDLQAEVPLESENLLTPITIESYTGGGTGSRNGVLACGQEETKCPGPLYNTAVGLYSAQWGDIWTWTNGWSRAEFTDSWRYSKTYGPNAPYDVVYSNWAATATAKYTYSDSPSKSYTYGSAGWIDDATQESVTLSDERFYNHSASLDLYCTGNAEHPGTNIWDTDINTWYNSEQVVCTWGSVALPEDAIKVALSVGYTNTTWRAVSPCASVGVDDAEKYAVVTKFRYRFRFVAKKDAEYKITYRVRFHAADSTYGKRDEIRRLSGLGTGLETIREVDDNGQDLEVDWKSIYYYTDTNGCSRILNGWKNIDLPCSDGGCSSCAQFGSFTVENACVKIKANLGNDNYGNGAGSLSVNADTPSTNLYTPASLGYYGSLSNVTIVRWNGLIKQLVVAGQLVNVSTISSNEYQIVFYDQCGPLQGRYYATAGSVVSRANLKKTQDNTLQVTVTMNEGGANQSVSVWTYVWSDVTHGWTLTHPGQLQIEQQSWDPNTLTKTLTVKNGDNTIASQVVETHYREAVTGALFLKSSIRGTTGAQITNSWIYYDDSVNDGVNFARVRWSFSERGDWTRYDYNSLGLLQKEVHPFLDTPTNAPDSQCRVISHDYSLPTNTACSCETVIETVLGQEVSRHYSIKFQDRSLEIDALVPGAHWDSSNVLTTTNTYIDVAGKSCPATILNPNGTVQFFAYGIHADGTLFTTNVTGQPNASRTAVVSGQITITQTDSGGRTLWTQTSDVAVPGLVLAESVNTYYSDGRLQSTRDQLQGAYITQLTYDCCGVATSTDRDGTVTSYGHDLLKRVNTTTRNGVTISNSFDAVGNVCAITRYPSTGSPVVQSASIYDAAGRLWISSDAIGNLTTNLYGFDANGRYVETNLYPDGGVLTTTYYKNGSVYQTGGSAAHPTRYEYGADANGRYTRTIKLDAGDGTSEWVVTYTDMAGRQTWTLYPDGAGSVNVYNGCGQLTYQFDPDNVVTSYQYNGEGELEFTSLGNRVTHLKNFAIHDAVHGDVRRSETYMTNDAGGEILVATTDVSTDGLRTWNIAWNGSTGVTVFSETSYGNGGLRYQRQLSQDGSAVVQQYQYGVLQSIKRTNSAGTQLSSVIYGYDFHGRQITSNNARNGVTTNVFDNADRVVSILSPSPDPGQPNLTNSIIFDSMGRAWITTSPDGATVTNTFTLKGEKKMTYGSRMYPVQYGYDAQGRMTSMTNWQDFRGGSGVEVTRWNYDSVRGWMNSKRYNDNTGPSYLYYSSGRLKQRTWARNVATTYGYNSAGDLTTNSYTDGITPTVVRTFDGMGRLKTVTEGGTALTTFGYNNASQMLTETHSGGLLDGVIITNIYDALLRRTTNGLTGSQSIYTYDTASRLSSVTQKSSLGFLPVSGTYTYVANSSLMDHIVFAQNGTTRMTTTNQYDLLDRLTNAFTGTGTVVVIKSAPRYNSAGQRTNISQVDGSYWVYQYDSLGQVNSGKRYWSDGTPVASQQFEYSFDDIGNRTSARFGGDQAGNNLRSASYTPNTLNQYTSRTVPGYVEVSGSASNTATVYVGNQQASRKGDFFWSEAAFDNTLKPVWGNVAVAAYQLSGSNPTNVASASGYAFIPLTPEVFGYDLDGNLTNDGRWIYTWDAENRLVKMESQPNAPLGSKRKLEFAYDYQSRRTQKIVSTNNGTIYVASSTNRYIYDGWNLVSVLDSQNAPQTSFAWGTDASGSLQGAGGVGGLIAMTVNSGSSSGSYFFCYDANWNVLALANASNGSFAGQYEYGPFGELIRANGSGVKANPFRFSTKFMDEESDLVYYGLRYYSPSLGKWLSRDPIEEMGGLNLYACVQNDPANEVDPYGLDAGAYIQDLKDNGFKAATHRLWVFSVLQAVSIAADATRPLTHRFLQRYLDGTGSKLTLTMWDIDYIRSEPVFAKVEQDNIKSILQSASSGSIDYQPTDYIHHYFQWNVKPVDLFSAFHGMDYRDKLKGTVCKSGGTITFKGRLTLQLHDNWNFSEVSKGGRKPFDTPSTSWLPDSIRNLGEEEFRQLELHGYTKPFDIEGEKTQSVVIKVDGSQFSKVNEGDSYSP